MERMYGNSPEAPLRWLVTGSSGLVGTALRGFLSAGGHEVARLVRGAPGPAKAHRTSSASWDPTAGRLDPDDVSGYDVVVHLAGAGIADGRWTAKRKAEIRGSRVQGTDLLARSLAAASRPPRVLVCASAVGFYGDRGDMQVDEGSAAGRGFLADTARAWEAAAQPAIDAGIRVAFLRTGIVLSSAGGALSRMLLPFRVGLGGPLGDGRQYWSWIALDELVQVVLHVAATEELAGPVNAVAPGAVRNAEFSRILGRVLCRPTIFRVPAPVIRLLLGEMGQELLLAGARVRPTKLIDSGYDYRFAELEPALRHVLGRPREIGP